MKVALIIGHNPEARGAVSWFGQFEFDFWDNFCTKHLKHRLDCEIFHRRPGSTFKNELSTLAKEVQAYKPDLSLEFHFNAFDGDTAIQRSEILHLGYKEEKEFAYKYLDVMKKVYNLPNKRAVEKNLQRGSRGYHNLQYIRTKGIPAVLLEPFFGDVVNKLAVDIVENQEKYAQNLAKIILEK